jgi:hypothetical protein
MRKILIITSLLSIIFVASCKDSLDPFGETNEKYVVNCIIKCDTNYQVLTLTHSYTATNYDPYSSTTDPAIKGAIIRLWEGNDKVTFFSDTTISRDTSSSYKTPYSLYHASGIQPDQNTVLTLEVILPSGKKLTATSTVPLKAAFTKLGQLDGKGDTLVPPPDKDYVKAQWGTVTAPKGTVYLPRMYIIYKVPVNGVEVRKTKLVPKGYFTYQGVEYPEYPAMSNVPWLTIDMSVIKRCLTEISEGDSDKSKYKIYSIVVDVLSLDANLSTYYNATNKNKDPYAVKLYETDFSNITGGFGVFGASYLGGTTIDISAPYVRTFGYVHGYSTQ